MTQYEEVQRAEAKKTVEILSHFVNNYGHSADAFAQAMGEEHRTIQQSFTGLCLTWLKHLNELESYEYDLRNEASVQAARHIAKRMREIWGESWNRLPLI